MHKHYKVCAWGGGGGGGGKGGMIPLLYRPCGESGDVTVSYFIGLLCHTLNPTLAKDFSVHAYAFEVLSLHAGQGNRLS